jgi:hypothetical protein
MRDIDGRLHSDETWVPASASGPRWVRVRTVAYGRGWSPVVTSGSNDPQVAGPAAHAAGRMKAGDSDCGPEGRRSTLLGPLASLAALRQAHERRRPTSQPLRDSSTRPHGRLPIVSIGSRGGT